MLKILGCALAASMLLLTWSAGGAVPAKKKKAPVKKATSASTSKRKGASKSASRNGKKGAPQASWRNRQLQPTPDRYKEIQDALAAKGFLRPEEATGKWDQTSVDALKRFQEEQKIESTGKINSLSLIALGLGPRHDPTAAQAPPPAAAR